MRWREQRDPPNSTYHRNKAIFRVYLVLILFSDKMLFHCFEVYHKKYILLFSRLEAFVCKLRRLNTLSAAPVACGLTRNVNASAGCLGRFCAESIPGFRRPSWFTTKGSLHSKSPHQSFKSYSVNKFHDFYAKSSSVHKIFMNYNSTDLMTNFGVILSGRLSNLNFGKLNYYLHDIRQGSD